MRKLLVILGVAVVALGAGAAVGVFLAPSVLGGGEQAVAVKTQPEQVQGTGPIYSLKERVLNLSDKGVRRYVKLGVALEFRTPEEWRELKDEYRAKKIQHFQQEMDRRAPLLNDAVTTIVSVKSSDQLADAPGKELLRDELLARFKALLGEPEVVHVYFTEFLMQ